MLMFRKLNRFRSLNGISDPPIKNFNFVTWKMNKRKTLKQKKNRIVCFSFEPNYMRTPGDRLDFNSEQVSLDGYHSLVLLKSECFQHDFCVVYSRPSDLML